MQTQRPVCQLGTLAQSGRPIRRWLKSACIKSHWELTPGAVHSEADCPQLQHMNQLARDRILNARLAGAAPPAAWIPAHTLRCTPPCRQAGTAAAAKLDRLSAIAGSYKVLTLLAWHPVASSSSSSGDLMHVRVQVVGRMAQMHERGRRSMQHTQAGLSHRCPDPETAWCAAGLATCTRSAQCSGTCQSLRGCVLACQAKLERPADGHWSLQLLACPRRSLHCVQATVPDRPCLTIGKLVPVNCTPGPDAGDLDKGFCFASLHAGIACHAPAAVQACYPAANR